MKGNVIDKFFLELDREVKTSGEIIITGAQAGSIMGNVRPSRDIDFEMRLRGKRQDPEFIHELINKITLKVGIAANYSEDISHWSMIDFLDYRKKAAKYKKIGKLNIRVMAPEYWTIGKMARYLDIDMQDVIDIIRIKKLNQNELIALWGRALKASPLSLACGLFRDHVKNFIKENGKKVWGKRFEEESALELFKKAST